MKRRNYVRGKRRAVIIEGGEGVEMDELLSEDNGKSADRPPNQPDELCGYPQSKPGGKKVITYKGPCCDTFEASD
jgi:hypothetical protein